LRTALLVKKFRSQNVAANARIIRMIIVTSEPASPTDRALPLFNATIIAFDGSNGNGGFFFAV
jgi:hypothetical protein